MKILGIKLLLSVLYIVADINNTFCQNYHAVPINNDKDKTLVTVRIGNITIPKILLDTGFDFDGIIIYNPTYSDSIDLTGAFSVSLGGAGNQNAQNALMIDSTSYFLGDKEFTEQRIIVMQSDIFKGFPSNGIIGYSLFGHYAVEIDFDRGVLILHNFETFKPDTQFKKIPIYFKDNRMIPWMDAALAIDDEEMVSISAYIDFADSDPMVLLERETMKFNLPNASEKRIIGTGLSGDIYGSTGKISKLIIGSYQLNDVKVSIAPAEVRSKQKNADVVIGCGAMNRFNLIFDYRNKYLYLKPNKSFRKPFFE